MNVKYTPSKIISNWGENMFTPAPKETILQRCKSRTRKKMALILKLLMFTFICLLHANKHISNNWPLPTKKTLS